jgi:hypothetical protein
MFPKGVPDLRKGKDLLSHSLAPRPLHVLKKWIASNDPIYFNHWSHVSVMMVSPWLAFWFSWRSIILDYISRSLTFGIDKFVAVSGLASVI